MFGSGGAKAFGTAATSSSGGSFTGGGGGAFSGGGGGLGSTGFGGLSTGKICQHFYRKHISPQSGKKQTTKLTSAILQKRFFQALAYYIENSDSRAKSVTKDEMAHYEFSSTLYVNFILVVKCASSW